jgi:hypothetical protein
MPGNNETDMRIMLFQFKEKNTFDYGRAIYILLPVWNKN